MSVSVPRTHKEAEDKNRAGQRSLDEVHEQKRKAALRNPGSDRSKENADRARRGDWGNSNEK